MKTKVMELIEELGFTIMRTDPVYGVDNARVIGGSEDLLIRTKVTSKGIEVTILPIDYGVDIANFYFDYGWEPDLRFLKYTPEMFEIARRFGELVGFDLR